MKFSDELKSAAIVGTAQKEFRLPNVNGNLNGILSKISENDQEKLLLTAAAILFNWQKAGQIFEKDEKVLPEPAKTEIKNTLSKTQKQLLQTLLDTPDNALLTEFFTLMPTQNKIIPPEMLSKVFDSGFIVNKQIDLRTEIVPVIGERGKWLAKQNSDWNWALVEEKAPEIWETAITKERIFALGFLRKKDPEKALELLASAWKSESAKERQKFLEVLEQNLSTKDAEFLDEIWQTDKSSEVRRTAIDLASLLPNSGLVGNLKQRAVEILNFKKGGFLSKSKIEVEFPNGFDNLSREDIVNDVQLYLDERKIGKKSANLIKILSFIPPDFWQAKFDANIDEILKAVMNSEWKKPLIFGIAFAAERFSAINWLTEIIDLNLGSEDNPFWFNTRNMPKLADKIQFEVLALTLLNKKSNLVFLNFAEENNHFYSAELSRNIIKRLYIWLSLAEKEAGNLSTRKLYYFTKTFAERINFTELSDYLDKLKKVFPQSENIPKQIQEAIIILEFRLRMHESFLSEE